MRRATLAAGLALGLAGAGAAAGPPAADAAIPTIHAHRGGALDLGVPARPEDTLEAFRHTAAVHPDAWLELDAVVSRDGVPFVLHDSTLDRTTDCSGAVPDRTAAEIEACRVDVLGVSETLVPAPATPAIRVPRLRAALAFARETGRSVNLEIKRIPGDPGYVPGSEAFAEAVMADVVAAGLPGERLIVQSFDPSNLETARRVLPGVQTSLLTLAVADALGPALAAARGYDWVSPGSVPTAAYMAQARALGLKVVPYTLNTEAQVRAAAAVGVDALITDDVPLARQALGLPAQVAAPVPAVPRGATVAFPRRTRAQVLARGGVAVLLRAPGAARATVTLRRGRTVVARGTVRLARGGERRRLLALTATGRRLVRAARVPLRLTARVVVGGRASTRAITLR
ncbi:glycerophosphodiester phosphodiesterase [Paraconexibacter algicola]|uniref:GP-PDE domain-containing protein n=1 Tax=Paraconexibacter algicola TaxID=2133960 RepID=A0A2T4UJV9_9ACTN|nr:glycerophosphodiester phosphodiesterase family protein [Paraconexibacter algicola]PTL59520.1 hypothetical protein C7Y72_07595 [Paraconexibacter algicola]